ncbi:ankyrin [Daldinia decipiens]|uniref:ankyrin n=1 Tax=Daldinia decipiens TaxID=326647 RepID=UPI0020C3FC4E|nr:ankyrin [Daldinia decipiens]KAI1662887.1 ankyrin [Daldinia decipiens]
MDVISAVASFIAIGQALAATPKIIDILTSLFGARHEMIQLTNELVLLNEFGIRIRERIQDLPHDPRFEIPQCISLSMIEANTASIISQLEELCRKCQQEVKGNGPIKFSRVRWLWYRPKITSLSKRATMNRGYLHAILDSASFFASTSNGRMLLDIHTIVTTQVQQTTLTQPPLQFIGQEHYDNESTSRIITDDDSSEAIASSINTTMTQEISSQLTLSNVSREGSLYMNHSDEETQNDEPIVQIMAALRGVCTKDCACQCHSSTSRIRPHPATPVIYGWLKSAYNGAPRLGAQSCDVPTCQRARSPRHFNFRVPLLFCSRTLEATLSFSSIIGAGASLHLRVPRMLSIEDDIHFHINHSNMKGILWEMSYSRLSPLDQIRDCSILLRLLDLRGVLEAIPILLDGARSIVRGTDTGKQAAMVARHRMEFTYPDNREQTILREVIALDDESAYDSWRVHEAVRTGGDLIEALKESPEDIDALDDTGNTPLHLAVLRRDNAAMQILISHGANMNSVDIFHHTPLWSAIFPSRYDQARILIDSGCDINFGDRPDQSALLYAIRSGSKGTGKITSLLLHHGASTFNCGRNALHRLAASNKAADMEEKFNLLIGAGVNVEEKNAVGRTVLMQALHSRNGHMLRLLVGAGYRFDEFPSNKNALIKAAWRGYTESINILEQTEFTADVRMQNKYGLTPLEMFEWRMRADPVKCAIYPLLKDDIESFWKLLQGVRDRYLTAEIQTLEKVITHIEAEETELARETLQSVIQEKINWNIPAEYRTFRAIDVQIREEMAEAAIESLEEFIEVSKERIGSHPQDNDYFYEPIDEEGLVIQDMQ